jgi:hypothetical protein
MRGLNAVIWTCFFVAAAYGQQQRSTSQASPQDSAQIQDQPGLTDERPLTPAEQREKQIRAYDPLDKNDPRDTRQSDREKGQGASKQKDARETSAPRRRRDALPGSVAASNQSGPVNPRSEGPEVTDDSGLEAAQQYTGPAVLSRSYTLSRPMTPEQVKWSWNIGYMEAYSTGLLAGPGQANGTISTIDSFGHSLRWSLTGRHFWKHDQIGLDYAGNQNNYAKNSSYNGSNQSLNLDYTHEFSRTLFLNLIESGSIYSTSYSLENPLGAPGVTPANLDLQASPAVQVFDQGTKQFTSMADLTWKKTARLSFNLGGGFFVVERQGYQSLGSAGAGGYPGLFGNTGYQARADVTYRYTRKMTVGAYYSFTNYVFTHHIDVSNSNTVGAIVSYAFGRTMQLRLRTGVSQVQNLGYNTVPVDPVVALLTGRNFGIVDAYTSRWSPDASAELVKDFGRQRSMNFSYARGISPGNGLQLTSSQENITGGFSMRLFRRYTAAVSGGRSKLQSLALNFGNYDSEYVTLSVTRPYAHGITGVFSFDYRTYNVTNVAVSNQSQMRISSGITWGPGEGKLW